MLRSIAWTAQFILLALIAYNAITAMWGWKVPAPARPGSRARRVRVVIPAHNEEKVIEGILEDLAHQSYPDDHYRVWVLADRCGDRTVELARQKAEVIERHEGPDGKGAAIAWYLAQQPLAEEEALVILDADNRVPVSLLERVADEIDDGHDVLQVYLDVGNPDDTMLTVASALTYWSSNRMVQLARRNLGWSCDLGGTGTVLTKGALREVGGFGNSVTEDQEMAVRLALRNVQVTWLHDVRVSDEKPRGVGEATRQRARWMAGKKAVAKRYLGELFLGALRQRRWELFDLALRLVQPGRSFVALASAAVMLAAFWSQSPYFLDWRIWPVIAFQAGTSGDTRWSR
jgi:cellulose synthase/poly-beta-1,6-N-acetylglucosamine synthase-like glycosyltransferase